MKQFNIVLCALGLLLLAGAPLFAEHEFSLRLAPAFQIPAGQEHFGPGVGGAAALEWAPLQFPASGESARQFSAGLSAGGGFGSFSVDAGGVFSLFEGGAGPFVHWHNIINLRKKREISPIIGNRGDYGKLGGDNTVWGITG
jgi:hypothetical protein